MEMNIDEAIARFELRSRQLTAQAWLFLSLVLVLLLSGALAVIYAQNLTASDIGAPSIDQKTAAIRREQDRITARTKQIEAGAVKECGSAIQETLKKWASGDSRPVARLRGVTIPTGDLIVQKVEDYFKDHPERSNADPIPFLLDPGDCSDDLIKVFLSSQQLAEFKSVLSGKIFVSATGADELKELRSFGARTKSLEAISSQLDLEKIETEVGVLKEQNSSSTSKVKNDLF